MRRVRRHWLHGATLLVLAVYGIPLFGPARALAQADCGSAHQVIEQITLSLVAEVIPSEWVGVGLGGAGLHLTESPGPMFIRCWHEATGGPDPVVAEEPEEEEEEYEDPYGLVDGSSSDDPHLTTYDRLAYDFHGAGDYVLMQHAATSSEVQGRYVRNNMNRQYSAHVATALRVGDRVVSLYEAGPDGAGAVILDGEPVPFLNAGWYEDQDVRIQQFGHWTFVRFSNGLAVASANGRINRVHIPNEWAGEVSGLLGNGDGDPRNDVARRDGTIVDPRNADALYDGYLTDWFVAANESLFSDPFNVAAMGPILPGVVPTLATLPADAVASARELCVSVGLQPDQGLEACIFDVALTGDESWATADAALPSPVMTAAAIAPRVTRTLPLGTGNITGLLETPGVAHEVIVPAAAGEGTRVLQANEFCDAVLPAAVIVMLGGEPRVQRSLVCGTELDLPTAAHRLLVVHPAGSTADYAFSVAERAPDTLFEAGPLPLGSELTIPADNTGQRRRWALDDAAATEIFIRQASLVLAPDATAAVCTARWSLLGTDDAELAAGSLCINVPRLNTENAAVFEVELPAGVAAIFMVGRVGAGTNTVSELQDRLRYDGELQSPGQVDTYTLELEAGTELVLLDPVGSNDCSVFWSVAADGAERFRGASCFDTDPIAITTGGTVEVAVRAGNDPGRYSLEIVNVPEPRAEALRFNETLDASIVTPGERVRFTFAGTAGEELVLANPAGTNANCQLVWRIAGPASDDGTDNIIFEAPTCFDTDPIRLVTTGAHVLEIDGNRGITGAAAVTIIPVPEPRTQALRFGEALDASIEVPGQRVRFTFAGAAGDELLLSDPTGGNDNCQIVWRIIGPDTEGVVFEAPACLAANPIALAVPGPYVLEVDGRRASVGAVAVFVERQ